MKNFVKPIDREGSGFAFLQEKSPRISMEKYKADIFEGLQIRELMKGPMFDEALSDTELFAKKTTVERDTKRKLKNYWKFSANSGIECQTSLSTVILGLFSKELSRFEWRAGWSLSPRHSNYGTVLLLYRGKEPIHSEKKLIIY